MHIDRDTVVVITGASGGVGRATAGCSASTAQRWPCWPAAARDWKGRSRCRIARRPSDRCADRCQPIRPGAGRGRSRREREFGPIDLWINNAMVSMYSPFMKMTPEEFKHIVEVTFLGQVHGTRCAWSGCCRGIAGVIIQVGSALAFRSIPLQSAIAPASMRFRALPNRSAAS